LEPPEGNFLQRVLEWGDCVARRLADTEYAVAHVRSIWEGTPALLLQPGRRFRLVYEANGLPSVELKYHYPALSASRDLIARLRSQERALLRAAHAVITQSRTTRKYLAGLGAVGDRLHVIPNGVDPDRFEPRPPDPEGTPERPLVLYLGTLAPWQGVPFLVEAFRLVLDEQDARLRIVGTGRREWRKECERLILRLALEEHVELRDPVPPADVPALLAASDACVAPLTITDRNVLQGCCPIKILEYLAAGKPVVAARLPAVREVLTDGETGILYKPDKPRRLAEALLRLFADPALAHRLGTQAAREVRERFTWDRHNEAVGALYQELLAGG
jgi:glycosyltransferase involved in cell wall biosynthesis